MKKVFSRRMDLVYVVVIFMTLLMTLSMATTVFSAEKKTWRFYSTPEGGFAYTVAMGLIRVANQHNPDVQLVVTTGKGTPASYQLYEKNEVDTTYSSTQTVYEAWANEGVFSKSPVKYRTYQGVYLFTGDHFFVTKAGRNDIKSLADLAGKKVFPWYRGSGSYDTFKLILEKLGLWDKITDRQMGTGELADALKSGALDVLGIFAISQATVPSAVKELETRADIQVVNPTEKEKEMIAKVPAVFIPPPFPPTMFSKPVGTDKIIAYSNAYGWGFGPNEDTDRVYGIVKAWYEHSRDLVAFNPGFEQFSKTGLEMNVATIESLSNVPVHPGVAKYLKERGVWKNHWKIGELFPRTR